MYDMRDTLSYHFSGVTAKENYSWGLKEQKMISNQILQNTIEGLKGIARVELCVMALIFAQTFHVAFLLVK